MGIACYLMVGSLQFLHENYYQEKWKFLIFTPSCLLVKGGEKFAGGKKSFDEKNNFVIKNEDISQKKRENNIKNLLKDKQIKFFIVLMSLWLHNRYLKAFWEV